MLGERRVWVRDASGNPTRSPGHFSASPWKQSVLSDTGQWLLDKTLQIQQRLWMRSVSHRRLYLNTGSPTGDTICIIRGPRLGYESSQPHAIPSFLSLPQACGSDVRSQLLLYGHACLFAMMIIDELSETVSKPPSKCCFYELPQSHFVVAVEY